ncbi:MAG: DUF5916 domain-containing protein [Gemmatimonadota bacterium]|jgi:hypothetical protein
MKRQRAKEIAQILWLVPLVAALGATSVAGQQTIANRTTRAAAKSTRKATVTPPTMTAVRLDGATIHVDGRLDDPAWQTAKPATNFIQTQPDPGAPATQRTEARVLYSNDAIYVGVRMYDTHPDSIVAQLARRDDDIYSDWVYVAIDSYNDKRTAFTFALNPRGVKLDLLLHDDTQDDGSWDAVWDGAAAIDSLGWTAEFRIPLSQLRFSNSNNNGNSNSGGQVWGIDFMRVIARNNEQAFWAPVPADNSALVSRFGKLRGIHDLKPPRHLEIMPYTVGSATTSPSDPGNPFHRSVDPFGSAGADIKAGVTSDLTLTATLNPDFGQVEADPSVVNLTAFETFFPEKRPFFVEGSDIFRFSIGLGDGDLGNESLFYSRRIGRRPQGEADGDFVDVPDATTILGAAKLSGKTAGGWSIGVLDAVTNKEYARTFNEASGLESRVPVEPLTNYAMGRVIKDFRQGQSAIGAVFTAVDRSLPGVSSLSFLRSSAYTGGFDVRHRFHSGTYEFAGSFVGSTVFGSREAIDSVQTSPVHYFQRADASHLRYDSTRTSLSGFGGVADFSKIKGNWRYTLFGQTESPGLELNDMGFQSNSDLMVYGFWGGYQQYEPGNVFRRWSVNINGWDGYTYGGEHVSLGGNINFNGQLNNYWGGYGGVNRNEAVLSTSMLRGGPAFLRPGATNFWAGIYSDSRRNVSFELNGSGWFQDATGSRQTSINPSIELRPTNNADLSIGPSISWNRDALQYVGEREANGQSYSLLGTVDQTTISLTARLNYTFSPTLSLQFYAQPFISAGAYSHYKVVTDPRATRYADRVRTLTPDQLQFTTVDDETTVNVDVNGDGTYDFEFDDPSFNFKQLRSNLVLRWEYLPGSTLFVVWSQGRTDYVNDGRFSFGPDVNKLFNTTGTNVLLVKVSYWLGL